MKDEYLWRNKNTLAIRDGQRSGLERRKGTDRRRPIPSGMFANWITNKRDQKRRTSGDRRRGFQPSLYERLIEMAGSMYIGFILILLGIISIITGITFFPLAGVALGSMMMIAGIIFIIEPA